MAKKKGRTLLIKIGATPDATEFDTLCALQTKTLTLNNEEIDVTTPDCANPDGPLWHEVLDGVRRVTVAGNGLSKKDNVEARLAQILMSSPPLAALQVIVPNFGSFQGVFFIQSGEFGGEQSGGVTFSLTAASSGEVTFKPEEPVA